MRSRDIPEEGNPEIRFKWTSHDFFYIFILCALSIKMLTRRIHIYALP
jgi:hypothetical protein